MTDPKREPVVTVYESSSPEDLPPNWRDGMEDMLGDDILSSDYTTGEEWPGVNPIELPPEWQAAIDRIAAMEREAAARGFPQEDE